MATPLLCTHADWPSLWPAHTPPLPHRTARSASASARHWATALRLLARLRCDVPHRGGWRRGNFLRCTVPPSAPRCRTPGGWLRPRRCARGSWTTAGRTPRSAQRRWRARCGGAGRRGAERGGLEGVGWKRGGVERGTWRHACMCVCVCMRANYCAWPLPAMPAFPPLTRCTLSQGDRVHVCVHACACMPACACLRLHVPVCACLPTCACLRLRLYVAGWLHRSAACRRMRPPPHRPRPAPGASPPCSARTRTRWRPAAAATRARRLWTLPWTWGTWAARACGSGGAAAWGSQVRSPQPHHVHECMHASTHASTHASLPACCSP